MHKPVYGGKNSSTQCSTGPVDSEGEASNTWNNNLQDTIFEGPKILLHTLLLTFTTPSRRMW